MTGRFFLRAVKTLIRVTLSDSFRIRPPSIYRAPGIARPPRKTHVLREAKFSPFIQYGARVDALHRRWLRYPTSRGGKPQLFRGGVSAGLPQAHPMGNICTGAGDDAPTPVVAPAPAAAAPAASSGHASVRSLNFSHQYTVARQLSCPVHAARHTSHLPTSLPAVAYHLPADVLHEGLHSASSEIRHTGWRACCSRGSPRQIGTLSKSKIKFKGKTAEAEAGALGDEMVAELMAGTTTTATDEHDDMH